jgi:predicted outer membrane repeat protein
VDQSENYSSLAIIVFQNNSASYSGGAIGSDRSILIFTKSVIFEANTARDSGGAMSLFGASKLILVPRLNISFTNIR